MVKKMLFLRVCECGQEWSEKPHAAVQMQGLRTPFDGGVRRDLEGVNWLRSIGFRIYGAVIDGMKSLPQTLKPLRVQLCQFYQILVVRRYLGDFGANAPRKPMIISE